MGENTKIEWTDHTFNPWRGCQHATAAGAPHPGCEHCYAEQMSKRNPGTLGVWGGESPEDGGVRVMGAESYWKQPLKWNAEAERAGVRERVFCASLADVFEAWWGPILNTKGIRLTHDCGELRADGQGEPMTMDRLRRELFNLIDATPWLNWLLLTKRPENIRRMWPGKVDSGQGTGSNSLSPVDSRPSTRSNVWLLTSVSNQATSDAMIPELLKCRDLAPALGLSMEPLLGEVDLSPWLFGCRRCNHPGNVLPRGGCPACGGTGHERRLDWIIVGGESGPHARPCNIEWVREIIAQSKAAGVPCFVKQLGSHVIGNYGELMHALGETPVTGHESFCKWRFSDPKGGNTTEWPADLRVRQFPVVKT